jgi:subtilisin family serine protease
MSCGANLAAVVPQSGWWWAAAAPGSGYSLEERNGRLFAAAYMYRADGSPAWYLAQGNLTGGPVRMAFHEFGNGQTLTGAWRGPTVRGSVGTATLTISTPTSAALTWDGAASPISLSRYGFAGAPPPAEDRETARPKTPKTPSLGATSVSQDTKRPLAGGLQALRDGTARTVRAIVRLKPAKVEPGQGGPKASSPPAPSAAMSARQSLVAARVIAGGGSLVYRSSLSPVIVVDLTAEGLRGLEARTDVESIADDGLEFLSLSVSAPRVGADRVWNAGHRGAETAVAVLDSGIDTGHPFFGGRIADEACFSTNYSVSDGSGGTHRIHSICPNGATEQFGSGAGRHCADLSLGCYHGTHVAGIAAGSGSAFSGVAPAAKVVGIQVFSRADPYFCGGNPCIGALVSDTLRALEYAYGNAARWNLAAVNMSLGGARHAGYCDQDPRKPAIDNLRSLGVATVIAAGNDYETAKVAAPSCISSAVRVSATFSTSTGDDVEIYANEWALPLILAPGTSINSADPGGGFARRSGTSMAAPHVAGAWALIRSVLPSVGVDRVYDALASTGAPVRSTYTDRTYPRIDVAAALGVLDPLPETGWWWNASEPGRGFFLEVQGRTVFVSAYAYDETGRAEWYISQNALIRGGAYQGTWQKFVDGQSLGGAWRAPRAVGDVGTVALRFSGPRNAVLTLPTGVEIPIARFTF